MRSLHAGCLAVRVPRAPSSLAVAALAWPLVAAAVPPGASGGSAAPVALASATLDPPEVAAHGAGRSILTVPQFGRWAVSVKSAQGTAVQLVDAMAGPGEVQGEPGAADGRVDAFLDRGRTLVRTTSDEHGKGRATLSVHAFREIQPNPAPSLVELKQVDLALADYEQASFWVSVPARRKVLLEAAGRNLADLRLWRDGAWLVDAQPQAHDVPSPAGRPLRDLQLATTLEPGNYLLTAYGGPGERWADDDGSHPLHLRWGIPKLGTSGRARFTVGPFGAERFLVPKGPTFFQLELPAADDATLAVGRDDGDFDPSGPESVSLDKKSKPPVADLSESSDAPRLVVVTAAPGQVFVLQQFLIAPDGHYPFPEAGDYWVSAVNSGSPLDTACDTAILLLASPPPRTPIARALPVLDSSHAWSRRFNLLATTTVFVDVKEAGKYVVQVKGTAKTRCLVEPFFANRPEHYQPPTPEEPGHEWDLSAGFHVVTLLPDRSGIAEVTVARAGLLGSLKSMLAGGVSTTGGPSQAVLGVVHLPSSADLYVNQIGEMATGVVVRRVPLDLTEPLPLVVDGDSRFVVPMTAPHPCVLSATAEDGTLLPLQVDGRAAETSPKVDAGAHEVVLAGSGQPPVACSLLAVPETLLAATPLPPAPDAVASGPPVFFPLSESDSVPVDLQAGASATFSLAPATPALYRIESEGVLAMDGVLRTRTAPELARSSGGGTGRNFLVQQYLREGDYQVTVSTHAPSAGHALVSLSHAPVRDGGILMPGIHAAASLDTGEAISYRVSVPQEAEYHFEVIGLKQTFACRLEDSEGWPLLPPGSAGSMNLKLAPGDYRLIVLPPPVAARAVTTLEVEKPPIKRQGHGPHELALGETVEHAWAEPAAGGTRDPDCWNVEVPATATLHVTLTNEMAGEIHSGAWSGSPVAASVTALHPFVGELPAGHYQIRVKCARRNNGQAYKVSAWTDELLVGQTRTLDLPCRRIVSVEPDQRVEIASFSRTDVSARLLTESGTLVASNDDAPEDWNFRISRPLRAGRYILEAVPVDAPTASAVVAVTAPVEDVGERLPVPAHVMVHLPASGRSYLLGDYYIEAGTHGAQVLLVSVASGDGLEVSAESGDDLGGSFACGSASGRRATLVLPVALPDGRLRYFGSLRLGSLSGREADAVLDVRLVSLPPTPLAHVGAIAPVPGLDPPLGLVALETGGAGVLRLRAEGRSLWTSSFAGRACTTSPHDTLAVDGSIVVVAVPHPEGCTLHASRVVLSASDPSVTVEVRPRQVARCDVAQAPGVPVVLATSMASQPCVRLVARGDAAPGSAALRRADSSACWERGSAAASPERGELQALTWLADDPGATSVGREPPIALVSSTADILGEAADVRLELVVAKDAGAERAAPFQGLVEPATALRVKLGSPSKAPRSLDMVLPPRCLAVASREGQAVATWGGGDEGLAEAWSDGSVGSRADSITLVNLGNAPSPCSVELRPSARGEASQHDLEQGPLEADMASAGVVRLSVPQGKAASVLHARGPGASVRVLGADGSVSTGVDARVPAAGGVAELRHGAGPVVAWLSRGDVGRGSAPWGRKAPEAQVHVAPPASLDLSGDSVALEVDAVHPAFVRFRTSAGVVTSVSTSTSDREDAAWPAGAFVDRWLPDGHATLWLRGIAGRALSGTATITEAPVTALGDGLGPEVVLGPGDSRAFSFHVDQAGAVGAGVRASSDVVDCTLLDATGQALESGVVLMKDLQPGDYLLALHAPPDVGPVRAQPALAGLKPPGLGPPAEIVRQYVTGGAPPPPLAAGAVAPSRSHGRARDPRYPVPTETGSGEEGSAALGQDDSSSENDSDASSGDTQPDDSSSSEGAGGSGPQGPAGAGGRER